MTCNILNIEGDRYPQEALDLLSTIGIVKSKKLNRKELSEYKIAIPPIDEQKRICAHLETLDLEEENLLKHRSLLVEVKNQICRECLEGCYV